jgi:hypothetical protein
VKTAPVAPPLRLPRFRRVPAPPAFRLTDDDLEIIRHIGRHRFLRSTHIAALVGRSLDRTNDRLSLLYHAGYLDRPRAQLDRFPTDGSSHLVYALADRGVRFLVGADGHRFSTIESSRRNREAGRPFIEHHLEIADFQVALRRAARDRTDVSLIDPDEMAAGMPGHARMTGNPFSLKVKVKVKVRHRGAMHDVGLVSDLLFGLALSPNTRRFFMAEIDRGTMPVTRSDFTQSSVEKKMRAYLAAYAGKQQRRFGWKSFRVLIVTTDEHRMHSMIAAARKLHVPGSIGPSLFFFATREELRASDPLAHTWHDGLGKPQRLAA